MTQESLHGPHRAIRRRWRAPHNHAALDARAAGARTFFGGSLHDHVLIQNTIRSVPLPLSRIRPPRVVPVRPPRVGLAVASVARIAAWTPEATRAVTGAAVARLLRPIARLGPAPRGIGRARPRQAPKEGVERAAPHRGIAAVASAAAAMRTITATTRRPVHTPACRPQTTLVAQAPCSPWLRCMV